MIETLRELTHGRKILILVWFFILASILAFFLRDIVGRLILPIFLYATWLIRIVYETLPQAFWWIIVLFVLVIIAVKSLIRPTNPNNTLNLKSSQRQSRLELWLKWLEQADQGGYFGWYLAHELSLLTLDVLSSQERYSSDQLDRLIRAGLSNLPSELQNYIQTGLDHRMSFHFSSREPFSFFRGSSNKLKLQPEEIAEFLERRLEGGGESMNVEENLTKWN